MKTETKDMWSPFYVAGVQFHQLDEVIDELKDGSELYMIEEHHNKYDPYAVAIYYDHRQLGYVPKTLSPIVTNALYNSPLSIRIVKLDRNARPWNKLQVQIVEAEI